MEPVAAISLVFLLLAAFVWRFRVNRRTSGQARRLECLDTLRLTPQHTVGAVRLGSRVWLVALHGAGVTLIAEIAAEDWPPR